MIAKPPANSIKTTWRGVTYPTRTAACEAAGVGTSIVEHYIRKGAAPEEAIERAIARKGGRAPTYTVDGIGFQTYDAIAAHFGLKASTIRNKTSVSRLTPQEAVDQLLGRTPAPHGPAPICGFKSRKAAARAHGVQERTIRHRLRNGWTDRQAVGLDPKPPKGCPERAARARALAAQAKPQGAQRDDAHERSRLIPEAVSDPNRLWLPPEERERLAKALGR